MSDPTITFKKSILSGTTSRYYFIVVDRVLIENGLILSEEKNFNAQVSEIIRTDNIIEAIKKCSTCILALRKEIVKIIILDINQICIIDDFHIDSIVEILE